MRLVAGLFLWLPCYYLNLVKKSMMMKILVVDNHPVMLNFMTQLLEKGGHHVRTAEDGLSALEILKSFIPDVAFVDLVMPNIDGRKLCRMIRGMEKMKDVNLIIISGIAAEEEIDYTLLGVDACIVKGPSNKLGQHVHMIIDRVAKGSLKELSGKVIGIEDVYERAITKELLHAKKHSELIFDNLEEGIIELSSEEKIVYINPSGISIIGIPEEKLLGVNFTDFFDDIQNEIIKPLLEMNDDSPRATAEASPLTINNKQVSLEILQVKGEKRKSMVVILHDITERMQDAEEKERLETQLRQAHKMEATGTLAGGIAHDFNNILGIIVGNTELSLSDIPEWNPAYRNMEAVIEACMRARDVVGQLLSFSRKSEQQKKPVKIAPIIKETSKFLRASIPSNIDIHYTMSEDSQTIMADPTQIHQVILNLCTNAADAMLQSGGILEIGLDTVELGKDIEIFSTGLNPGLHVRLTVRDTGEGISPTEIGRIFDPYFTTKEVGKGTGLGLSVVHGIVKDHNGEISVHSKPGKGTLFEAFFPISEEAEEEPALIAEKSLKGNESILFVDDEKVLLPLVKKGLERLGYNVEATTSATEALELFRSKPDSFNLVITDTTMPKMNGVSLAKKLTEIRPDIPIILCTGYSESVSEEQAYEMGISAFLMKPILAEEIAVAIRNVLDRKEKEIPTVAGRVLVVDDEEQVRTIIRQILESSRYEVIEAPDGKVALWLFKEKPADLIITDLIMPEKEGLETIEELRKDYPDVKIIAISGGGLGDKGHYLDMAKKIGADNTLAKPFQKEELLYAVKEALG